MPYYKSLKARENNQIATPWYLAVNRNNPHDLAWTFHIRRNNPSGKTKEEVRQNNPSQPWRYDRTPESWA